MARYIDADELLNKLPDDLPYKASVKRVLMQAPTADVVPKSEVDKWKEINEQLHKEMSERMLEEVKVAKKYLAREIFEEIERETKNHGITYAQRKIAELKKKYTEGNNEKDI